MPIATRLMTKTETTEFEMIDNILVARYTSGKAITKEVAQELVRSRKEFMQNKECKVIIVLPRISSMDKGGRDYLSSPEAKEGIIASGMVTTSILSRAIINFFLKLSNNGKNDIPTAVFNSEEDAMTWLKKL